MLNQICQPLSAINSIAIGGFFCWQIPQNEGYFYTSLRWTVSRREKVLTKIVLLIFKLLFTVCRGFPHEQKLIIDFMSMSHIALMSVILIMSEKFKKAYSTFMKPRNDLIKADKRNLQKKKFKKSKQHTYFFLWSGVGVSYLNDDQIKLL